VYKVPIILLFFIFYYLFKCAVDGMGIQGSKKPKTGPELNLIASKPMTKFGTTRPNFEPIDQISNQLITFFNQLTNFDECLRAEASTNGFL